MEEENKFNPFNYRPFIVREWTLEQFENDNKKLWDEVWVAYQKRDKSHFTPKPTKQDVLNDVRYLLVNASKHNLKQISNTFCNVLADSEALASVAQKLLDDMNSDINIPQLDLSIQGEDPKLIPYIILKTGISLNFLDQLKKWFCNHDEKDRNEKLRAIYNDEEIVRLCSLLSFFTFQLIDSYKFVSYRSKQLFCEENCLVPDIVFLAFVNFLDQEVSESLEKKVQKDFFDVTLPFRAAKEAGCFRELKKKSVESAFLYSEIFTFLAGDNEKTRNNNFSLLNNKPIKDFSPEQQKRMEQLKEAFAAFAPSKTEETGETDDGKAEPQETGETDNGMTKPEETDKTTDRED